MPDPPKAETFLVLDGAAEVILFDHLGQVTQRYRLGAVSENGKVWGVDLEPGVWDTITAVSDRAVCFEGSQCLGRQPLTKSLPVGHPPKLK